MCDERFDVALWLKTWKYKQREFGKDHWIGEAISVVEQCQVDLEVLRVDKRRRHALYNAGLAVEIEKTKHALEHARRGDFKDDAAWNESCGLPVCFVHDPLRRADFEREQVEYWIEYLADNDIELALLGGD